jgi:hypothetical protein
MKPKEAFIREFHDELLGMAVQPMPMGDPRIAGMFIRERINKVKALLDRMHNWLNDVPEPKPPEPAKNGQPPQQPQTVRK